MRGLLDTDTLAALAAWDPSRLGQEYFGQQLETCLTRTATCSTMTCRGRKPHVGRAATLTSLRSIMDGRRVDQKREKNSAFLNRKSSQSTHRLILAPHFAHELKCPKKARFNKRS